MRKLIFVLIAVMGVAVAVVLVVPESIPGFRIWDDTEHAQKECEAAVGFAQVYLATAPDGNRFRLEVSFWPVLENSPTYLHYLNFYWENGYTVEYLIGFFRDRVPVFPRWTETVLALANESPAPLDCTDAFARAGLPLLEEFTAPQDYGEARYGFSRIIFSSDGTEAFVLVSMICGNVCGSGTSTVWRKEGDRWRISRRTGEWIS